MSMNGWSRRGFRVLLEVNDTYDACKTGYLVLGDVKGRVCFIIGDSSKEIDIVRWHDALNK